MLHRYYKGERYGLAAIAERQKAYASYYRRGGGKPAGHFNGPELGENRGNGRAG